MKKNLKYNLIIYSSLLFAIVCMLIAVKGHYDSLEEKESFSNDIKEAIKEMNPEEIEEVTIEEPDNMKDVDKTSIINNIFNDILDRKTKNNLITRDMILTWGNYEISNIEYIRQITDNYYCYKADILIFNLHADIPVSSKSDPDIDEYLTITLYFNINYNEKNNSYNVKTIEIPNR